MNSYAVKILIFARCLILVQLFLQLSENAAVKELLKLVNIWTSYSETNKGSLFMDDSVVIKDLMHVCRQQSGVPPAEREKSLSV